jgi:hypothetical protein
MEKIPLKVLIIDEDKPSSELLCNTLKYLSDVVISVHQSETLNVENKLIKEGINTIYIDPLSIGLDKASNFIFSIRNTYPSIVFVLYVDFDRLESRRNEVYKGERGRFRHYFMLNKLTPTSAFEAEVKATIRRVQGDLNFNLTGERITELQKELARIQEDSTADQSVVLPLSVLQDIQNELAVINASHKEAPTTELESSVFLSYRFADTDEYIRGLSSLLEKDGFTIITGQDANTYISTAILDRIRSCQFFLCLMTRADEKADGTFTTSPWLLEEKGAALAFGKKIVLMVEDGISDIGGLQGDWQRIHFTPKGFTIAALKAVQQLKSYLGT